MHSISPKRILKTCTRCKQTKSKSEFPKQKRGSEGLCAWCRKCDNAASSLTEKKRLREHPEFDRNDHLKSKYGITLNQYDILLESQNGVCAICKQPPTNSNKYNKVLFVDHDHITGKVRGLLCYHCNVGLGHFKDNTQLLTRVIEYLNKRSENE